jgi:glycosyltransferase involved in cell wall biosynthesis
MLALWEESIKEFVGKNMMDRKKQVDVSTTKRHCMVVHARYPLGETRVEREARALVDHGYEVDVICLRGLDESRSETVNQVNVHRLPVMRHKQSGLLVQLFEYLTFFVLTIFKLTSLHRRRHYNVVQVHNLPDWLIFVGFFPKLTGARLILDLHDLMPEFYAARFKGTLTDWPVRLLIWQEKISCQYADHVITVTESWKETLIKRGIPAAKLGVVMNVPDDRIFSLANIENHREIGNNHLKLLYHGNVTYRYGVDLVIRAVDLIKGEIPNVHLHIHGWGDARQSLIDLTEELGLQEYVSFGTKGVLTTELPALIRQADICFVPYRRDVFTDGILPTKMMEYAALEMPVIAARTSAIQAYFNDSMAEFFEPGNLADLTQCIRTLYQRPDRLMEITQGCRKFNGRYNWTRVGAEYVELVNRLGCKAL